MKRSSLLAGLSLAALMLTAQPVQAQFFKQLGKFAEKVGKKVLEDALSTPSTEEANSQQETEQQASAQAAEGVTASSQNSPHREIHLADNAKRITVRGGMGYLGHFTAGKAIVASASGNWFVIDKQGNTVFKFPEGYEPAEENSGSDDKDIRFSNGRLMIITKEKVNWKYNAAIIDDNGNIIKELKGVNSASPLNDGLAIIERDGARFGWSSHYVNADGNEVACSFPTYKPTLQSYCSVWPLRQGLRRYYDSQKNVMGYMDENYKSAIPAKFRRAYNFGSNGLALAQDSEELWGFINKQGNWVIEPQFTNQPSEFVGGLAMVLDKSSRAHFINEQGKVVWSNANNYEVRPFVWAGDNKAYAVWRVDGQGYIINTSFQKVAKVNLGPSGFMSQSTERGFVWAEPNHSEENLIFDWSGNLLREYSACEYGGHYFSEGLAHCSNYYYNEDMEAVIVFVDTQF